MGTPLFPDQRRILYSIDGAGGPRRPGWGPRGAGAIMAAMSLLGAQFVLALEPSSVAGAAVSRGLGSQRVRSLARVPLAPDSLSVSPFEPNLRRPDEVREALVRVAAALGLGHGPACIVLPDGVARLALLDVAAEAAPDR